MAQPAQAEPEQPSDATVGWNRLHQFRYPHGKDAAGVSLNFGKCLVLPTNDQTKPQLYEWNLQRSFPFPAPQQARFGAVAVNWNEESLWILGGADEFGRVSSQVEQFVLSKPQNPEWKWNSAADLPTPRVYAAAVAIPTEQSILVIGGRNGSYHEVDSVELGKVAEYNDRVSIEWTSLSNPMLGRRMGCAAVLLNETSLLVVGGYDGRSWQKTCFLYEFPFENLDHGAWQELPEMLETVRFVKAVRYCKYVLVVGEKEDVASPTSSTTTCVQCFDTQQRQWTWVKYCSCPSLDSITLQGPYLYGLSAGSSEENDNKSPAGIYSCKLSEYPELQNALPVVVGTAATPDIEAPTIVTADAVLVATEQDPANNSSFSSLNNSMSNIAAQPYRAEGHIKIRNVVKIKLSEKSYYTGQLRKKDGTYVPHGQGLLVWVEDDKEGSLDSSSSHMLQQSSTSYYKGQFFNGFRHGLGEMYLRVEDKHYFGSFEYGSWDGVGSLKIRSRGFSFFGQFVAGEMTGKGRCSYRVREDDQWKQKTYAGGFNRGKAHGKGIIADYMTGKIETDEEFHENDLFELGAVAPEAPAKSMDI